MRYITQHPIKKSDLGFHGNLFGGKLLAWLDAAAREGQLLKIYGNVIQVGTTSITLRLEARSHNVYNGKQNVILDTNITFVRVDEMGDAIPIAERVKDKLNKQ